MPHADEGGVITAAALKDWALPHPSGSKRDRGTVLVIGGSASTPGAAMLAGLAALRVGAGVLSMATAGSIAPAVAVAIPEASVSGQAVLEDEHVDTAALAEAMDGCQAVLAGPGLTDPAIASAVVDISLRRADQLVLDAFALGVLPDASATAATSRTVLTPNASEAAFLLRTEPDALTDRDATEVAGEMAESYAATVTYQGVVAAPDGRRWTVPTGHAGLGTSGSGDVLAGCAVGLLARGADPAQAACWATFLHATAGDRLAAKVGRLGFLARELVDELPLVLVQTEA